MDYTHLVFDDAMMAALPPEDEEKGKEMNKRDSLLQTFVYLYLRDHSTPDHHIERSAILSTFVEYPYNLNVNRRTLSRAINTLEASRFGIHSATNNGVWYDKRDDIFA